MSAELPYRRLLESRRPLNHHEMTESEALANLQHRLDGNTMGGIKDSEAITRLTRNFLRDADDLPALRVDYPASVVSGEDYFPRDEKLFSKNWVLIKELKEDVTKAEIKEFQDFQRALARHKIDAQYLNTEATKHKNTTFGADVGQLSVLVSKEDWVKLHNMAGMETAITTDSPVGTQQLRAGAIKTQELGAHTTAAGVETPEGASVKAVVVTAPANALNAAINETTIAY